MDVRAIDLNELNFRNKFETHLKSYEDENKGSQRKIWTKAKVEEVLNNLRHTKIAKTRGAKLKSMEYYWSGKYDSIVVNGQECITFKKKKPEDPTIRIIPREEFFDILKPVHISCCHGGRDKMLKSIKNKFYIPKKAIELYSSLCPVCGPKRNNGSDPKNSKNTRPINHLNDFNTKGVVDILDFQSHPDGEFKWLLKYQDYDTKFLNLRPLKSNETKEIALELVKIFLTFGPPSELQSLTSVDCIDDILKEISACWPDCKIINGSNKIGYQQRNQSANSENFRNMLLSWMDKNDLNNWSVGCFFYQYYTNSSSSYRALFCREPKDNIGSTNISSTVSVLEENDARRKTNRKEIPETITENCTTILQSHNDKMLESNNVPLMNDEDISPLNTQLEHHDVKAEIKIEFDDSEIYYQHDNDNEENSINSNNASEPTYTNDAYYESKHSEIYDKHDEFDHNLESKCTDLNTVRDEPHKYFDENSKLIKLKIEPMDETDPLQNTCAVCKTDMFLDNTIQCFNCNDNIHKACGIFVTYKGCDIKELCLKCASKRVPGYEEKVAFKGTKRGIEEAIDNVTRKRVLSSTSGSDIPGRSSD